MFRLQGNPTFTAPVHLTVPGAEDKAIVAFTFRHKGRRALAEFRARIDAAQLGDVDVLMEVIEGWGEEIKGPDNEPVPFTKDALLELIDAYRHAASEIWQGYLQALGESRLGN